MLVDDDPDGRFFTERRLRKSFADCALVVCTSADEATGKLDGARIDAIVTDHQLGHQSGCDFIAHARRQGITCPIVMVTCSADPAVAENAYRAGATKVFTAGNDEFAEFLKTQLSKPTA
jgi:CheY-like chemotaxis protein